MQFRFPLVSRGDRSMVRDGDSRRGVRVARRFDQMQAREATTQALAQPHFDLMLYSNSFVKSVGISPACQTEIRITLEAQYHVHPTKFHELITFQDFLYYVTPH